MRRTWRKAKPKEEKKFRINAQIRVPEVFLIDENGEQKGPTATHLAIKQAQDIRMDLVEVNPAANPPVAKIIDFGQFKYENEKRAHKQKVLQKKVDTKEIRLSVRISEHDFMLRVDQAVKFFQKGHKIKIDLVLKGREKAHPEKAVEIITQFVEELKKKEGINLINEQDLTKQGGRFIMVLVNKVE